MLPDTIEHCIVFMNYWDVSGVFWSFSKCKIKIPHLPADPSIVGFKTKEDGGSRLSWAEPPQRPRRARRALELASCARPHGIVSRGASPP